MNKEDMQNMVVLKNLPSNLIEEAIVIFKPHVKVKSLNLQKNESKKRSNIESQKYIVSEAQMVIHNYISEIENKKKISYIGNKKIQKKYKKAIILSYILGIALCLSMLIK